MVKGIVRAVDSLGRLVVPKEFRKELGIKEHDEVEISLEDGYIKIKPYEIKCVFCETKDWTILVEKNNKHICINCIGKLERGII